MFVVCMTRFVAHPWPSNIPMLRLLKPVRGGLRHTILFRPTPPEDAAFSFSSDPSEGAKPVLTYSGTTNIVATTGTGAGYPGWSTFSAVTGIQWRCVNIGVEVKPIASMMNNQGSVGGLTIPATSAANNIQINFDSLLFENNTRQPLQEVKGFTGISKNDGVTSKLFKYAQTPVANSINSYGIDPLCVYVTGGPVSTPVLQIRLVANYELLYGGDSIFNALATPARVDNPTLQKGTNYISNTLGSFVKGGKEELEKQSHSLAQQFGSFLVQSAGAAIGGYFAGPAGAAAGRMGGKMLMDSYEQVD